jgi:hypothetical protein
VRGGRGNPEHAVRIDNPAGGSENEGTNRKASSETRAQVAELADALDSGSSGRKVVEVRVLSWAPNIDGNRPCAAVTPGVASFLGVKS